MTYKEIPKTRDELNELDDKTLRLVCESVCNTLPLDRDYQIEATNEFFEGVRNGWAGGTEAYSHLPYLPPTLDRFSFDSALPRTLFNWSASPSGLYFWHGVCKSIEAGKLKLNPFVWANKSEVSRKISL